MDTLEQMNDMYVKCWLEGCTAQSTDIHWRAKKGKASWNYRMKFDVELGHSSMIMKFPYLRIQTWDQDVLKWNDIISEKTLDIGKHLRKAYKKQEMVEVYKDPPKKSEAAEADKLLKEVEKEGVNLDDLDLDLDGLELTALDELGLGAGEGTASKKDQQQDARVDVVETQPEASGSAGTGGAASQAPPPSNGDPQEETKGQDNVDTKPQEAATTAPPGEDADAQPDAEAGNAEATKPSATPAHSPNDSSTGRQRWMSMFKRRIRANERKKQKELYATTPWSTWLCNQLCAVCMLCKGQLAWCPGSSCCRCLPPCYDLSKKDKKGKKKGSGDDEEEIDEKTQEIIDQFRELMGLGERKPKDSEWILMDKKDDKTGERIPMGKLCISMQIIPKPLVDTAPAGFGRTDPNTNPYLPPPTGRLKFSLNPFVMGSELCGPKICAQLTCCIVCAGIIALMIFCQPVLNLFVYLFIAYIKS